jgi:hypothetical protein
VDITHLSLELIANSLLGASAIWSAKGITAWRPGWTLYT